MMKVNPSSKTESRDPDLYRERKNADLGQGYYPNEHKRIPEFDVVKTIAVISMIFVHVLEVSSNLNTSAPLSHGIATVIEFLGCVPSAGVFMFLMGWGAAMSRKTGMKSFFDRFLQLFLLGLLVNFFQQLVPMILNPEVFGKAEENLYTIIAVDIYQFASLATLYFAIMQKLNKNTKPALLFSVFLLGTSMIINVTLGYETFTTGNNWYDTLIGFFIRENEYSYFPFISWILFPISGYGAAFLYQKGNGKKNLLLYCFALGCGLILLSEILMNLFSIRDVIIRHVYPAEEGYYAMHPVCGMGAIGIILTEISLVAYLLRILKVHRPAFCLFVSQNVIGIYVTQWILIGLLSPVLNTITDLGVNMLFSLAVLLAACTVAKGYRSIRKKLSEEIRHALHYLIK